MLKRATAEDIASFEKICKGNIIGTKILCQLYSYGFERDFLEGWILHGEEGAQAVFTSFYDNISLVATDDADYSQLKAFFEMRYFESIMCSHQACIELGYSSFILKKGYVFNKNSDYDEADKLKEEDMHEAYSLICREIPDSFKVGREAYLSFLSDYTFRERRGFARGVCTHYGEKLSSVAVTSAETDSEAIITGVACDKTLRKKGLGNLTVLSMVNTLQNEEKTPYVIALNSSAEGFYEHIGFTFKEKIAFVERKNNV